MVAGGKRVCKMGKGDRTVHGDRDIDVDVCMHACGATKIVQGFRGGIGNGWLRLWLFVGRGRTMQRAGRVQMGGRFNMGRGSSVQNDEIQAGCSRRGGRRVDEG